jgi:hypothetical protein
LRVNKKKLDVYWVSSDGDVVYSIPGTTDLDDIKGYFSNTRRGLLKVLNEESPEVLHVWK